MSFGYGFRPYVSVGQRRAQAVRKMAALRKKGVEIRPIEAFQSRGIARTFWGRAWCDHLEKFSDYSNRLPRGRTYVRNGSVCHLDIGQGEVRAMVMGSSLYNVTVTISELPADRWEVLRGRCAGQIGSLIELLQGRLSEGAMAVVTDRAEGLFPQPKEIRLHCDCPDWATMCKHVAAVLYGVGVRLDDHPELLFLLRGVNHDDLITSEAGALAAATGSGKGGRRRIADGDLADIFGIDVEEEAREPESPAPPKRKRKAAAKKPAKKAAKTPARKAGKSPRRPGRKAEAGTPEPVPGPGATRVTGRTVAALRLKLGMSPKQFARLLGTSIPTVGNWERTAGPLKMQHRTAAAWSRVAKLSKKEAQRILNER